MLLNVLKPVDSLLEVLYINKFTYDYSQVEGVPGSHTIICFFVLFFVCFSFNYPILITNLFINLLF